MRPALLAACTLFIACQGEVSGGGFDAATHLPDGSTEPPDAGAVDSGVDAGPSDAGEGEPDAGPTDAGSSITLRLFNAYTQRVDPRFATLPASLPRPQLAPFETLLAEVTPAAASVRFTVDGVTSLDAVAPFHAHQASDGGAAGWPLDAGVHQLKVEAFATADGTGPPDGVLETTFDVTAAGTDPTPQSGEHQVIKLWKTASGKVLTRAQNGDFIDASGAVLLPAADVMTVDEGNGQVQLVARTGASEQLAFAFIVALPDGFDANVRYPLLVFLHHGSQAYRGTDNDGTPLTEPPLNGPISLRASAQRHRFPAVILVPQMVKVVQASGVTSEWAAFTSIEGAAGNCHSAPSFSQNAQPALEVIDQLVAGTLDVAGQKPRVDQRRLYLTGHSMGGLGTWDWVERRPRFFAGSVPMAGYPDHAKAADVKDTPIWAFHHEIDCYNAFAGSNTMYQRVTSAPNNGKVMRLTKLTFDTGGACDQAHFQTPAKAWNETPGVLDWLFSQIAE